MKNHLIEIVRETISTERQIIRALDRTDQRGEEGSNPAGRAGM
jgi:hypothetical protein